MAQSSVQNVLTGVRITVNTHSRELLTLVALLLCTFAMVSLVGWEPSDPTWFTSDFGTVTNPCGPVGANLAMALFLFLGFGAWASFGLMAMSFLALARRNVGQPEQWLIASAIFWSALCSLDLLLGRDFVEQFHPGGVVGRISVDLMLSFVGSTGIWLVVVGVALTGASLLGHVRWTEMLAVALDRLETWIPMLGRRLWDVVVWGFRRIWNGAAHSVDVTSHTVTSAARTSRLGAVRVGRVVRRMGRSLARPEGDYDVDEDWRPVDPLSELDPSGLGIDSKTVESAREEQTAVPAEVGWEPSEISQPSELMELFPNLSPRGGASAVSSTEAPTDLTGPSQTSETSQASPTAEDLAIHKAEFLDGPRTDDGRAVLKNESREFVLPMLALLDKVPEQHAMFDPEVLREMARVVEETLASFKVHGKVTDVRVGPVVTTLEFLPDAGISVRRVANLSADLAMSLKALSVRIVAPIPGRGVVGIEIPSDVRMTIYLRELLASPECSDSNLALPCILGKSVDGRPMIADLAKMPHLLIGGTTGSGKSVGVNGMLMSLLYTRTPEQLRLLLIDPKKLEFDVYADIPHLLHPIVTDAAKASVVLSWACLEMDRRYETLRRWGVRNISGYNNKVKKEGGSWNRQKALKYAPDDFTVEDLEPPRTLPWIVIVIDELADLMMVAKRDVQDSIVRLAQMARACGIHLIVATQRPSVDVVTGLIKSNLPTRAAYKLRSVVDSRTILDQGGAEHLLGMGDMLYLPGAGSVQRCHGAFVSDDEVNRVADFLRDQGEPDYIQTLSADPDNPELELPLGDRDELYEQAVDIVVNAGKASTSMIQRHLKIGYNRAARIIELMEASGVVGPADGARPREVLVGEHRAQ